MRCLQSSVVWPPRLGCDISTRAIRVLTSAGVSSRPQKSCCIFKDLGYKKDLFVVWFTYTSERPLGREVPLRSDGHSHEASLLLSVDPPCRGGVPAAIRRGRG